jgi:uncharacterized protein (TIGR02246 family)
MRRSLFLAAGAALLLAACQSSKPQPLTAADSTAIGQVRTAFQTAWNTGNVNDVVALFTADAVLQPGDRPERAGRDAIRAYYDTTMGTPQRPALALAASSTFGRQDLAVESGTFTMTPPAPPAAAKGPAAAPPAPLQGKYLVVLRRQADGSWKLAYDADSFDAPMPPPAPAPTKPQSRRRG